MKYDTVKDRNRFIGPLTLKEGQEFKKSHKDPHS